jgi:hypothetical protein
MTIALLTALAAALITTVFALSRQIRIRKALEKLLQTILSRWRAHGSKTQDTDVDRTIHPDKWL